MATSPAPDSSPLAAACSPPQPAAASCRASLVTPVGRGAVATVLVTGDQVAAVVGPLWRPVAGPPLPRRKERIPWFGRWELLSGALEEVVVCRFSDQRLEVHCHGGPAAADAILATLAARGCQIQPWAAAARELEQDLLAAEARAALALCRTARTARILLAQYQGAWQRELSQLVQLVAAAATDPFLRRLDELLDRAPLGLHLAHPWRVALAGPPNVGKSSLANALAGYQRAIVSDLPGTTRDVLHVDLAVDGWPVELADTAGLRETDERIEASGVRRAQDVQAAADLILVVADLSQPWTAREHDLLARHPAARLVHTKADLVPAAAAADRPPGLVVSAHTGAGLAALVDAIARQLVPHVPDEQAAVPFTDRQVAVLRSARAAAADDLPEALRQLTQLSPYFQGPRE